ncbi:MULTISPECIES: LacI family DNA-binding transcriptional regulator [Rhizobium]|uniref:LacI family DNA-binding transcriptional regulator n=2 Tax=Rhizobium TaxID=379 RepID=A0AAF1K2V6_9HYPH|nr:MULTISPECIES: LacI family DNA-binding transcriptional regulator [Rhizobium]MBO9099780.1 LacI family DNA-binding transcriptional regulator [Rhizobium sp. L58/93]MBO9169769.1 LacI family DNA-binding transcriptional regulator [Rhizobium sp. L245/93]MBO9185727.1 LacI family DNA-binding transcriptional regulator [Rhizobium sp. E27B/91]MBO9131677.1 LacI family DNA-binding transcriptional regulator [Rhizobium sp. B209b/85]MBZ5759146.1 LacI family transcriptional regulator [Rhizobium sp. VS19-DR96]
MVQKIKLSTIAGTLGISTATVSLALRDSPLVAATTRERIKDQARALGYIYNRRAASLRTSRSGIIGVVVHDIMNPFYGEILKAIETELDRSRHTFILSNHYDSVEKQRTFIETLLQLGGDGVIMSPAIGTPPEDLALAEENGMPAILVARSMEALGLPTFRGDDSYGISLATNHLISLGHRSIAMIGGTDQTSTGRDRYHGYVNALRKAGIEVDPDLRIPGPRSKQGGFEAAVHFLSLPQKPTAAVCWNDLVAIGLMNGIARAGLVPGKDISVTGYDDLEEAAIATPALTTVWNGQAEVGRLAARALLDRLAGSHEPDGIHLIKPEMRIRQSTEPYRPRS